MLVILLKSSPVRQAPLSVESSDMSRSDLKPGFNKTIHKKNKTKIPLIEKYAGTRALLQINQALHKNTGKNQKYSKKV